MNSQFSEAYGSREISRDQKLAQLAKNTSSSKLSLQFEGFSEVMKVVNEISQPYDAYIVSTFNLLISSTYS